MSCSYNNGIETCFGSCILEEMPPDATAAQQLFAQRMRAAGRQALMYFHAFISTETNATQKYEECEIKDSTNRQVYYACPGTPEKNYPLFLADGTNEYSAALDKVIERAFTLGFSGIFHDEASSSASSYTSSRWDGFSVLLDADTKSATTMLGSVPLIRLQHKVQMLNTIRKHGGVLLLNGAPVTRTFREAAMQAGRGRVLAEVEAEQESFAFQTHLFTPVSSRLSECGTIYCIRAVLLIAIGARCTITDDAQPPPRPVLRDRSGRSAQCDVCCLCGRCQLKTALLRALDKRPPRPWGADICVLDNVEERIGRDHQSSAVSV